MIARDAYVQMLARAEALPAQEVMTSWSLAVDAMVGHCRTLSVNAEPDRDGLTKLASVGLFELRSFTELETMAVATSHAQACWMERASPEASPEQRRLLELAEELRAAMLRDLDYVADRFPDPDLSYVLREIRNGDSHDDLLQDLVAAIHLCDRHSASLAKVGFDATLPARAETVAKELGKWLRVDDAERTKALDLRNRFRTLLEAMESELRAAGRFLNRKNPQRLRVYASPYRQRRAVEHNEGAPTT